MLNISPIGRSCTQEERIEFYELDKVTHTHHMHQTHVHFKIDRKLLLFEFISYEGLPPSNWDGCNVYILILVVSFENLVTSSFPRKSKSGRSLCLH